MKELEDELQRIYSAEYECKMLDMNMADKRKQIDEMNLRLGFEDGGMSSIGGKKPISLEQKEQELNSIKNNYDANKLKLTEKRLKLETSIGNLNSQFNQIQQEINSLKLRRSPSDKPRR